MLSPESLASLASLRKWAESSQVPIFRMQMIVKGIAPAIGDDERHVARLGDYTAVFSVEEHPVGRLRHASISSKENSFDIGGKTGEILSALGFVTGVKVMAYKEKIGKGRFAFNFLQPLVDGKEGPLELVIKKELDL